MDFFLLLIVGGIIFAVATHMKRSQGNEDSYGSPPPQLDLDDIKSVTKALQRLYQPRRYPSAHLVEPYFQKACAIISPLPGETLRRKLYPLQAADLEKINYFVQSPHEIREQARRSFINRELKEKSQFFDQIETHPLTEDQRTAIVTDEDATLVLAGAGSGKTSLLVGKTAYLIETGIRKPEDILILAFNRDAASELNDRLQPHYGVSVVAKTFHAVAYQIIGDVEGSKPPLAAHANDASGLKTTVRQIINDLAERSNDVSGLLLEWFAYFFEPSASEWDFQTHAEYTDYIKRFELRALRGEKVKSFAELEIANWLYLNGIDYEYEPIYEHQVGEPGRRQYTPDFRLTQSGVYIEHFGVGREYLPSGEERLTTAPYIDRDEYLADMKWKQETHHQMGTTLIETYSYERNDGRLTELLSLRLEPYVSRKPLGLNTALKQLEDKGAFDSFTETLCTFLQHFKDGGYTIDKCKEFASKIPNRKRNLAFLRIFSSVHEEYQKLLGDRIDFSDMINRAVEYVNSGKYQSPYTHILVDEFQDLSESRANLIISLKNQKSGNRIFAVGDDWQSIYRFAGSDIFFMRHFGYHFGGTYGGEKEVTQILKMGKTFRCVDKIALPATDFVMKNPSQLPKEITPAAFVDQPAIQVRFYKSFEEEELILNKTLESLNSIDDEAKAHKKTSVLLLGRYRHTEPNNIKKLKLKYPNLSLAFRTIHSSKGLEADHVIILRAISGRYGFPSSIFDDPVLSLVMPEYETYPDAEERRVFYVALTRARRSVTVIASRSNPSTFATELVTILSDTPS